MLNIKLTKTKIDSMSFSNGPQVYYWDSLLTGFGVCVGKKSKVFIVQARINGKSHRIRIGKHGVYTLDQARKEAQKYLLKMSKGELPTEEKKKKKKITLLMVFAEYVKSRNLAEITERDYKLVITKYLVDWQNISVANITKEMVIRRHAKLKETPAMANLVMRTLKAIINYAMERYDDEEGNPIISRNPVKIIRPYDVRPRSSVIAPEELPALFEGLYQVSQTVKDYILLLLFTGLRKGEGIRVKWEHVDFQTKTVIIPGPNAKNRKPLLVPLSDYLLDLFKRRFAKRGSAGYVFPGKDNKGHIIEIRCQMKKITEISGISFILHDFRRTYITMAESLGISSYTYKQLANHKLPSNDVTARYINLNLEQKRVAQQKITDYILKAAGVKEKAEVIELRRREG